MQEPFPAKLTAQSDSEMLPLYASQFYIGPDFPIELEGWQRIELAEGLRLSAYPELSVTRVVTGNRSLALIGYLLDPDSPNATDDDILRRLLARFSSIEALISGTTRLGGRWVLIADDGRQRWLFHDALGLRQVHYTNPAETGALHVMSQPGLARNVLGFAVDDDAQRYMDSYVFRSHPEYRWPGAATAFRGVKRLLQNHVLDLTTAAVERYWPTQPLELLDVDDTVEEIAHLLRGLVVAGSARFDLALSVTAGIDSRLVLAAARPVQHRLDYVTVRQARAPANHADIEVPTALLRSLRLPHKVIYAGTAMSAEFAYAFKRSVFLAHDHYGSDAEAILRYSERKKVALTGSGAEVGRCFLSSKIFDRMNRTPQLLATLQEVGNSDFAVRQYREWLDDIGNARDFNLEVLDLFEWEEGCNWLAMTQLEFDIAWRDILTPYNCRRVLVLMLSTEKRYRQPPNYELFTRLIAKLWPEVLSEPINPHEKHSALKSYEVKLINMLRQFLYQGTK